MFHPRVSTANRIKNERKYPQLKAARARLGTLHPVVEKLVSMAHTRLLTTEEADVVQRELESATSVGVYPQFAPTPPTIGTK